ncbi:MAG: phosphopyruvate hydratase, partial [Pseudomonadota bacterium]
MTDTTIAAIGGRRVWDSRGNPTVEVEVRTAGGATGRAIAPAGASRGTREAVDLRDGGKHLGGKDVRTAVANVNEIIGPLLAGHPVEWQTEIDDTLINADG